MLKAAQQAASCISVPCEGAVLNTPSGECWQTQLKIDFSIEPNKLDLAVPAGLRGQTVCLYAALFSKSLRQVRVGALREHLSSPAATVIPNS